MAEFIGVEQAMMPTIRILDPAKEMAKYSYDGKIQEATVETIGKLLEDFKADKLTAFLKS